ncbi:hypothetical protein S40288_05341 [Stachybotrys chartarum IBT 40288]|nr:hypothetical protein S40288_05341 [Stachybotrys chartarum IBT 40288]
MTTMRGPRLQIGSAAWIAEERSSALQIAQTEVEEFTYSARNELDWLNEHMAGILDENEVNIAETFKTPGKLRGKTPRTTRKAPPSEARVPLSDIFAPTPNGHLHRAANSARVNSPRILHSAAKAALSPLKIASTDADLASPKHTAVGPATQDSGYYGSQDVAPMSSQNQNHPAESQAWSEAAASQQIEQGPPKTSPAKRAYMDSPEKTFQTAKEEQTTRILGDATIRPDVLQPFQPIPEIREASPDISETRDATSPLKAPSATLSSPTEDVDRNQHDDEQQLETADGNSPSGDVRSTSDGSSPVRPIVRKSSLNFASLPAREPLTAGKSAGARASRTSQLEHKRTSYYNRPTGGKSLGQVKHDVARDDDLDSMDVDESGPPVSAMEPERFALNHNKTYTQRLQDQISMLGKSQTTNRQSKSIPSLAVAQQIATSSQAAQAPKSPSPVRKEPVATTPGAFPEDDEDDDDWIEPPAATTESAQARPVIPKSHSTDIMEDIHGKTTIGQPEFTTQAVVHDTNNSEKPAARLAGHTKSSSASMANPLNANIHGVPLTRAATVNSAIDVVYEMRDSASPLKSPSRNFRDSPLKQVKNKLSSILKSSKGLLASSAAISAEGKSSMLSPSTARLGLYPSLSSESIVSRVLAQSPKAQSITDNGERETSPTRPAARRTRASVEREKEEKRREKEAKRMAEQMDKLEKAREKEREKARVFSQEQERIIAMEKQLTSKKQAEAAVPKETPKPTRTSPRKTKAVEEEADTGKDVEMSDAPSLMPPPSVPRSAGPGQSVRGKEIKRPIKPAKESYAKAKQAPTVIRVNTGSQHSQYHPSAGSSSGGSHNFGSSTSQPPHHLGAKASKASLQHKTSTQSLKSSASSASAGRPKALDLAAKKKEQDEREAQRRREVKAEMERKRAAAQEDQRKQEQQRRQDAEAQKQKDAEATEAKKLAQRQAAIERAKQTRAPPPAARSQATGQTESSILSQKGDSQPARPPSRMTGGIQRSQDDTGRPVNAVLSSTAKAGPKRPLGPDSGDDNQPRHPASKGGPAFQAKDAKRRRTSEDFEDELEMSYAPNIKGPPVRPSGGLKKDMAGKSVFQNGYSTMPAGATRDLFKATVTAQHNGQSKATHPLDMAQISKGAIPFAPNPNPSGTAYKTPARSGALGNVKSAAKSAQRSSPRFQNGDAIELPEIQTDDEDEDEEEAHGTVAGWTDSPLLRQALMKQEVMDPSQIFGPPAPLNMEEVFSKSKDKFSRFRARTSSANWSGTDRLTEDDIRKDMAARDMLRRDGGWTYEMSRGLS